MLVSEDSCDPKSYLKHLGHLADLLNLGHLRMDHLFLGTIPDI